MEKLGVAGVALGIFQGSLAGLILGAAFIFLSFWLTPKGK